MIDSSSFSAGWNDKNSEAFPDPFMDYASLAFPKTMQQALRWCEYIASSNGVYRMALDRVLSYFITDLDISDVGDDERERWEQFFNETLSIRNLLHTVGMDLMVYGNSFTSVLPGFKRYLTCNGCHIELPLARVYENKVFNFEWRDYKFHATCPHCKYRGEWTHIDRRTGNENTFRVKRWNPHEIELLWDPVTDDVKYIWKLPDELRRAIKKGTLFHLERANWEIIEACKHNRYIVFGEDVVHHMKECALAGVRNRGWGISRILANFKQAWYVQVIHRYNEAIALDYVIPFRLITPAPGDASTGRDPLLNSNMGDFMGSVRAMLAKRRQDPAAWNTLPFAVQYQALGGDARQLAPRELLEQGWDVLINSVGVPVELFKGSMTLQSAPAALRLFEATWSTLPHNLNAFLRFVTKRVSELLSWEPVKVKLARVTHADDLQRQQNKLQLMMGGQISQTEGLKSIGLDHKTEVQRKAEEQRVEAEISKDMEEELAASDQMAQMAIPQQPMPPGGAPAGGPMPPGGAPAGPMPPGGGVSSIMASMGMQPNQPITLEELEAQSQMLAQQIMGMPEPQKDSELIQLKKLNPSLHALVGQKIEDMRQALRLQGGAMMQAQMFGKTGQAKKPIKYSRSILNGLDTCA